MIGGSIRFSVTDREPKMPRSSGHRAMPALAIWFGISPHVSLPRNFTLPSRRGTTPMIDFIVVVLPAPLRPNRVTTSPSRTSKSTPCRIWLSPYQAFRPFSSSIDSSQIGGDDFRILRYRFISALGQNLAAGQNGDLVAEAFHDRQIVLHHQDGAALANAPDQFDDTIDVAVRHAGGG